jgi:integrase
MATKTHLPSGNFRIQFRVTGLKSFSRTFLSESEADQYHQRIESELGNIDIAAQSKLPVDMGVLFSTLHPDLKSQVQLLPAFARVLGNIAGIEMTLAQLIDKFVLQYEKKDQNILKRLQWWSNHYGHLQVNEMTEDYVRHGINTLLNKGSTGTHSVSPQTTNRFKANLSSVFEFGKNKYHLKSNPCSQIKSKPEGKGRQRYLTAEEQQRFLAAAKQSKWDKFYLLILMAITSGARRGELVDKLRWSDIDWDNAQAICRDTKNGSDKRLPLTEGVIRELRRFREVGNSLIFSSSKNPSRPYDFRIVWDAALKQAGINAVDDNGEKLVFHSLRHTFCSTIANTGAELHEIAALAGHKSVQTTMRYTHTDRNRLATVVNNTFSQLA